MSRMRSAVGTLRPIGFQEASIDATSPLAPITTWRPETSTSTASPSPSPRAAIASRGSVTPSELPIRTILRLITLDYNIGSNARAVEGTPGVRKVSTTSRQICIKPRNLAWPSEVWDWSRGWIVSLRFEPVDLLLAAAGLPGGDWRWA